MSEEEKTTLTEEENAEVALQEEKEPTEGEKTILPRQILGFGSVPSIKSLLVDGDSSDEEEAIKKIAKKCMDDFIVIALRHDNEFFRLVLIEIDQFGPGGCLMITET